ncbi:MAG TPA: autotransporter domain-containing protein [Phenylobacterium sp.]|jgi:outer membrane lipase/esterase|nr:autotransporter domain-containing protein [Phenylobacterium sp.]
MPTDHPLNSPSSIPTATGGLVTRRRLIAGGALAALVLGFASAAWAGEPDAPLTSIYVFGDSMSDSGTYADKAPPGAGKFTTNPDPVWVEIIASQLGLPALTSHAAGGTNYAEGGARVASQLPTPGGLPPQFSRTPVVSQVDNFFAAGGTLNSHSLVVIQGGGNDVFDTLFNGPTYTPTDIQNLTTAANALATQVKRVKDAGAGVVVTESVPKFDIYNQLYKVALAAAKPNVLFFDTFKLVNQVEANPARWGIVNTTDQACKVGPISSYLCTPALYVTPDADKTYLFADSIHFTGAGQRIEADAIGASLIAPNLIGQLSYAAQSAGEAQSQVLSEQMNAIRVPESGTWKVFGSASLDDMRIGSAPQSPGVNSDIAAATVGAAYALSPTTLVGGALSWSTLDGDFSGGGGFKAQTVGLGVFGRRQWGTLNGWVEADYGHTDFNNIDRRIQDDLAVFNEVGSTDGERFALSTGVSDDLVKGPLMFTPKASLRYDHGRIAGYAEGGDDAVQAYFGSQKLETLVASIGLRVSLADQSARFRPYAEIGYADDLLNQDRQLLSVFNGAPVPWTTAIYKADPAYITYGAGVSTRLTRRVDLQIGVSGTADRGDLSDTMGFVGLRSAF